MMQGSRILLRPIERQDLSSLNRWKNDESVFRFLGGGFQPVSPDQQAQWMDALMDLSGSCRRFIIARPDGTAVGMLGLYDISWINRSCEAGLYIGERDARRQGYAEEAFRLLEHYAAACLNLRKIRLQVVSDNEPAMALWTKLGFVRAGELHRERFIAGQYHDVTLMEKFIGEDRNL